VRDLYGFLAGVSAHLLGEWIAEGVFRITF